MYEAECLESEGLLTIGVMTTEESAIEEAKRKCLEVDNFAKFYEPTR